MVIFTVSIMEMPASLRVEHFGNKLQCFGVRKIAQWPGSWKLKRNLTLRNPRDFENSGDSFRGLSPPGHRKVRKQSVVVESAPSETYKAWFFMSCILCFVNLSKSPNICVTQFPHVWTRGFIIPICWPGVLWRLNETRNITTILYFIESLFIIKAAGME